MDFVTHCCLEAIFAKLVYVNETSSDVFVVFAIQSTHRRNAVLR